MLLPLVFVQLFPLRESLKHSMARVEEQGARVSVSSKSRAEIEAEAGGPKILALRGTVMAFVQNDGKCGHQDETSLEEGDMCWRRLKRGFTELK